MIGGSVVLRVVLAGSETGGPPAGVRSRAVSFTEENNENPIGGFWRSPSLFEGRAFRTLQIARSMHV